MCAKSETPLMRQYKEIKSSHPDTILLFRVGDFYETFDQDAIVVSRELGITLTKRNNGGDMTPLAGFPFHSVDSYLPKLVRRGYRVAVCEQAEDPEEARKAGRKIVSREVTEITTPGSTLSEHVLDPNRNNYLLSVSVRESVSASVFQAGGHAGVQRGGGGAHYEKDARGAGSIHIGVSFADVSTGEFCVFEARLDHLSQIRQMISPSEVVVPMRLRNSLPSALEGIPVAVMEDWIYQGDSGYQRLLTHFGTRSLKGFGVEELSEGHPAAGALLEYLRQTQKTGLRHLRRITPFETDEAMSLDASTKRNLELIRSSQEGQEEGSLISILDHTRTAMGGRLLRKWMVRPLRRVQPIQDRLQSVEDVYGRMELRNNLRASLKEIGDLERIISRVASGRCGPRDLRQLAISLAEVSPLKQAFDPLSSENPEGMIARLAASLDPHVELQSRLDAVLVDDPPATTRDGGMLRDGVNVELDELRDLARNGKQRIAAMRDQIVKETGISSLKLGYNKVFGYYIEVTKARKEPIPENFIRKQTLVNAERYITPELKEIEEKILHAEERMLSLELELFEELRAQTAEHTESIQATAMALAQLDVLQCFAEAAHQFGYVRPTVDESERIDIRKGRHPVVERLLPIGEPFISNDIELDRDSNQIIMITGPNMAGKSVILRQTGLIVLMAQIGSFVPAESAHIGLVDKIFTRVGASDNLASGESTFLVEMNEAANILNNATSKSLILLDEIGRGTSTFDGLSIAWSLAEYLHNQPLVAARTLFATHYHELNELAERYPRIRNANVSVKEHKGEVIFLRKLVPGGADHSYGIQVAALAGLPDVLLARAREILANLESHSLEVGGGSGQGTGEVDAVAAGGSSSNGLAAAALKKAAAQSGTKQVDTQPTLPQMNLFGASLDPNLERLIDKVQACDPERMTPLEAMVFLAELKKLLD